MLIWSRCRRGFRRKRSHSGVIERTHNDPEMPERFVMCNRKRKTYLSVLQNDHIFPFFEKTLGIKCYRMMRKHELASYKQQEWHLRVSRAPESWAIWLGKSNLESSPYVLGVRHTPSLRHGEILCNTIYIYTDTKTTFLKNVRASSVPTHRNSHYNTKKALNS